MILSVFPKLQHGRCREMRDLFGALSVLNMICSQNKCILGQQAAVMSAGRIHLAVRLWKEDVWCFARYSQVLQHSGCNQRGHKVVKCLPYLYDWDQLEAACLEVRTWKMICKAINWWWLNLSCSSLSSYLLLAKTHCLKRHCSIYFY